MEHLVEVVMEWLFAGFKGKPDSMPEIEDKDTFEVRYSRSVTVAVLAVIGAFVIGCALFFLLLRQEARWMGVLLGVPAFIVFWIFAWLFGFRCTVTTESLRRSGFGWRKKEVLWSDVVCVRVIEQTDQDSPSVTIAVCDRTRKYVIDMDTKMDNAWHVVKMAERKGIEIRKESNLSLKQMNRLDE